MASFSGSSESSKVTKNCGFLALAASTQRRDLKPAFFFCVMSPLASFAGRCELGTKTGPFFRIGWRRFAFAGENVRNECA